MGFVVFDLHDFRRPVGKGGWAPEPVLKIVRSVNSIDIGSRHFALGQVWHLGDGRYWVAHGIIADLKGDTTSAKLKEIALSLDHLFAQDQLAFLWDGTRIICESQIDQLESKTPIHYAMEGMIITQVLQRFPQLKMAEPDDEEAHVSINEMRASLYDHFLSRHGKLKYGLEGITGYDARKDAALEVGPATLRKFGDPEAAEWLESLPCVKRKPREDGCDMVLQAIRDLYDQEQEEQKQTRMREKLEKQLEARMAKKVKLEKTASEKKSRARVYKKRKREEEEEEARIVVTLYDEEDDEGEPMHKRLKTLD